MVLVKEFERGCKERNLSFEKLVGLEKRFKDVKAVYRLGKRIDVFLTEEGTLIFLSTHEFVEKGKESRVWLLLEKLTKLMNKEFK